MESKDKMIGTVLIIVGLFFIGLGVFVNMNNNKVRTTNNVYQEQVVNDTTQTNTQTENSEVNVYTETNTQDTTDETTRYIY